MKCMAKEDGARALEAAGDVSSLSGKKVLVLGATGMAGSVLAYALAQAGAEVTAAGRNAKLLGDRFGEGSVKAMEIFDVTNPVIIRQAMTSDSFDFIVDCAAPSDPRTALKEPVEVLRDNFFGLDNVLSVLAENVKAARRRGKTPKTPAVLFISSSAVYGEREGGPAGENAAGTVDFDCPFEAYAVAKGAAEALGAAYSRQFGLDVRIARPGIVYGPEFVPGDLRPFAKALAAAAKGEDVSVPEGAGRLRAEATYISDFVGGLLAIMARGGKGCYNVSNSEAEAEVKALLSRVAEEAGTGIETKVCASAPEGGACGEGREECRLPRLTRLDSGKLKDLGWDPKIGPEDGIALCLKALKSEKASCEE